MTYFGKQIKCVLPTMLFVVVLFLWVTFCVSLSYCVVRFGFSMFMSLFMYLDSAPYIAIGCFLASLITFICLFASVSDPSGENESHAGFAAKDSV